MAAGGGGVTARGAGGVRCRGGRARWSGLAGGWPGIILLAKLQEGLEGRSGDYWPISEAMEEEDSMDGVGEDRARNPLAFLGLQRLVASSFHPFIL